MNKLSNKVLQERAKQYYPQSEQMQMTWVQQTKYLYQNNMHAYQTGGFKRIGHPNEF